MHCTVLPLTVGYGQPKRLLSGLSKEPVGDCTKQVPGASFARSALLCKVSDRSISGQPLPPSRRRSKKNLSETVAALEAEFPAASVEVWSQDEACLGLQPVLRRVWAKHGKRPTAKVESRYAWLWLYAAVHPASGRVFWLILPHLDGDCVQLFLDELAATHLTAGKIIVLVWDGAPAHRTRKLQVPAGIKLVNYPAYTPELNPSERLLMPVKAGIVNERAEDITDLEEKIIMRCRNISNEPEVVKSLTSYHWWSYT